MSTITVELDEKKLAELTAHAGERGVSVEKLARDLLEAHAADIADDHFTPEQIAAIEAGLRAIEEGRVIPHDEVFSKLDAKYGW